MAVCKTCGKKYSKWAAPVSASGACPECFESELQREREAEAKEEVSVCENTSGENVDEPTTSSPIFLGCALIVISGFVLLLFGTFVASAFHSPLVSTLRGLEWFATLFANLVVAFCCFPAFTRTKNRAFLFISFAALSFAYGALFSLLLGAGAPAARWRISHLQAQWYYATRYATGIIGLILYAYGIASLARRAQVFHSPDAAADRRHEPTSL